MPTIAQLVAQNSQNPSQPALEHEGPSSNLPAGPMVNPVVTGLPVRGTYPPSLTLHTDFQNNTQGFRIGPNMRSAMFPNPASTSTTIVKTTSISSSGGGSSSSSLLLETNSMVNGSQKVLNLLNGSNISITADNSGNVTVAGSASALGRGTLNYPLLGQGLGSDAAFLQPRGNTSVVQMADTTTNPTTGNIAVFDANGNITDGGGLSATIATQSGVQKETYTYFVDSGSLNALAITPVPSVVSYVAGLGFAIKVGTANTGATTLNVSGLGNKAVKKWSSGSLVDLVNGDLSIGQIFYTKYDGTQFQALTLFTSGGADVDFYQTVQQAGSAKTQESVLNFLAPITATDNPGNTSTDIAVSVMVGDSGSGGVKGLVPAPGAGTAAANDFLKADGTWSFVPGTPGGSFGGGFAYGGDGNDSSITFDGSTNPVAGATLSGSTYTMTRDIFASDMTVNSGIILKTANYMIFATSSVTVNGTIDNSGQNAGGNNGGAHTSAVASAVGSLPLPCSSTAGNSGGTGGAGSSLTNGNPGAAGASGAAASNSILTQYNPANWSGGNGGNSSGNTGGSGHNQAGAGAVTPTKQIPRIPDRMFGRSSDRVSYQVSNTSGGTGGGGAGAGDGATAGGSGGAGGGSGGYGGFLTICTPTITIGASGIIQSNGGNGAIGGTGSTPVSGTNPAGGGGGAGGAGGRGGLIMLVYHVLSNSGSITVTHGSGGAAGPHGNGRGSGTNGSDGAAGPDGADGLIVEILT